MGVSRSPNERSMIWSAPDGLMIDARSKWPGGRRPGLAIIVGEGNLTRGRSRSQLGSEGPAGLDISESDRVRIDYDLRRPWPIGPCGRSTAAIGWTIAEINK